MASYGYTFQSGDGVTPTRLNDARTVSDIVNADIKSDAAIAGSKLADNSVTSAKIADGTIVNADINASAAIAHSKLANITSGQVLLGNASNVPTATALSGDVTVNSSGVTAIGAGVIVNADINASAAIGLSKLATGALPTAITIQSANIVDGTIVNADINNSAAIAHSKLANITSGQVLLGNASNVPTATAVTGDVTISNTGVTAISSGVIVNADINASAAIALSKLATGALPTAITVASANIVDGTIVNADINASAAIADTKLATISTGGKVSNSATTATSANTANAIVARNASGNFSAGTITASLTGNVTGNVTGNLTGTASAIADGSVSTAKIVDGAVTNAKIASGVDASKLTTGTLPADRIGSSAITTARINDAAVTPAKLSQPYTLATAQNSTSGTSIDFTGIPSWAKRITVMLDGVSTNGTSNLLLRLGTSGGFVTSGYGSWCLESAGNSVANNTSTAGILLTQDNAAAEITRAVVTVTNLTANTWLATGTGFNGSWGTVYSASVGLGGVLTQVRITTVNGTDTFDAGSINIAYEG